jgi:hypothetical protein
MILKKPLIEYVFSIMDWIEDDWYSHPFRFCVECIAWALSIGCSIILAVTVKDPALHILYPMWIVGCGLYAWASYTRKSFGMLANYILLTTIDVFGYVRLFS